MRGFSLSEMFSRKEPASTAPSPAPANPSNWNSDKRSLVPPPASSEPVTPEQRLAAAAAESARSLKRLAQVEQAKNGAAVEDVDEKQLPPELLRPISIEWSGPAEQLLARLAEGMGYSFKVLGSRPAVPVIVDVSHWNTPIYKVMYDASLQVTGRVTVICNVEAHQVEFRYGG